MPTLPYAMNRWHGPQSQTLADAAVHARLALGDRDMWVVIARADGTPWDEIAATLEMTRQGAALARKRGRALIAGSLVLAGHDDREWNNGRMRATHAARMAVRAHLDALTDAELIATTPESLAADGIQW